MIVEYVRYTIDDARIDAFEASYTEAQASLKAAPECLAYELSRCEEAPNQFILRIEWTSTEDHLKGFRGGPQFGKFLQAVRPFIDDIAEMQHYRVTHIAHRK